jgi:hypothetical protein
MAIYCTQALTASDAVSAQMVLRELAAMHRNQSEALPAGSQRVENDDAWMDKIEEVDEERIEKPDSPIF